MSVKRSSLSASQRPIIVTETCPLGLADAAFVREELADIAPDWSVDLHGICRDEATLVLLPEGGDDAVGPSFLISRETFGFRVDQVRWDAMHEVGVYRDLADAAAAIRGQLAMNTPLIDAVSSTVH